MGARLLCETEAPGLFSGLDNLSRSRDLHLTQNSQQIENTTFYT